jgi:SAM-dependent methyltransferase
MSRTKVFLACLAILARPAAAPAQDRPPEEKPSSLQQRAERLREAGIFTGGAITRFEEAGRNQLVVLLESGLQPDSKVLDIGCGMLRGGYWIAHFLRPGCYFGIEPDEEMLQAGLEHILGPELVEEKRPVFDDNDRFDLAVFGVEFDFLIAKSIWTHASRSMIETMLDGFVANTPQTGIFLTSYLPASSPEEEYLGEEWVGRSRESDEGGFARHSLEWIRSECGKRGLRVQTLDDCFMLANQPWLRITKAGGESR